MDLENSLSDPLYIAKAEKEMKRLGLKMSYKRFIALNFKGVKVDSPKVALQKQRAIIMKNAAIAKREIARRKRAGTWTLGND